MTSASLVILGVVLVLLLARRARGLITRQLVRPRRLAIRLGIVVVLAALVIVVAGSEPLSLLGDLAGLVVGILVGWVGLRLTRFEHLAAGLYYTPNRYIGLGVFGVFLARLVYKIAPLAAAGGLNGQAVGGGGAGASLSQYGGSDPLTAAAYCLLAGYYAFYYTALLLRARSGADPTEAILSRNVTEGR